MTDDKPALTPRPRPLVSQADEMTVCDNCSACRAEGDLNYIADYHERVEPGGIVPSGECPDCGCLCYPKDATQPEIVTVVRTGTEAAEVALSEKAGMAALAALQSGPGMER